MFIKRVSIRVIATILCESTNDLLIFLNVGSIRYFKWLFFGCAVIWDLYLFQEIVLLNPCFTFFKNLILSLIDKVTTATSTFTLVIWNIAPLKLLWCSDNRQINFFNSEENTFMEPQFYTSRPICLEEIFQVLAKNATITDFDLMGKISTSWILVQKENFP